MWGHLGRGVGAQKVRPSCAPLLDWALVGSHCHDAYNVQWRSPNVLSSPLGTLRPRRFPSPGPSTVHFSRPSHELPFKIVSLASLTLVLPVPAPPIVGGSTIVVGSRWLNNPDRRRSAGFEARPRKKRTPLRFGRGDLGRGSGLTRRLGHTGRHTSNVTDQWWFLRQRETRPRRRVSPGVSGRAR